MKYLKILGRLNGLKKKLQKHAGNDPQDWLDEERVLEIEEEIQKLEHGLDCYFEESSAAHEATDE